MMPSAPIKTLGQRLALGIERGCNRAFGARGNPFYYLGAIGFWLFLIVLASGLYVYAFDGLGTRAPYESLESISDNHRLLGGIVRSLHRHASDLLLLTMLLHMGRVLLFDRFRGARAACWITGVAILWLVWMSGINGLLLPWERAARFVVSSASGWIGRLTGMPLPAGAAAADAAIATERWIAMLAFLHVGVPIALLAGLWVHVRRVPGAAMMPPGRIAVAVLVILLAVAYVQPAIVGVPEPGMPAPAMRFDWFDLGAYPVLADSGPATFTAVVIAATLLLLALPWLPARRAQQWRPGRLTIWPGRHDIAIRAGDSLLDAGLRAGIALPHECRSGGCGLCKAVVLRGDVAMGPHQPAALTDADRHAQRVLLCCASAAGDGADIEIALETPAARVPPAHDAEAVAPHGALYDAVVQRLEPLGRDVMLIELRLAEGRTIRFRAGQHIDVLLADGARRSYSFTNASGETDLIVLHVRLIPGGRFTTRVFETMSVGDRLTFEGPLGEFVLDTADTRPLIFVAGATGFAPVKSLIEEAFASGVARPMHLYWGVRDLADLYLRELPERWAREHPHFRFVPVLSDPDPATPWSGRTGYVHHAILEDFPDLAGFSVYACGSLRLVESSMPAFLAHGLAETACHVDAVQRTSGGRVATVAYLPAGGGRLGLR